MICFHVHGILSVSKKLRRHNVLANMKFLSKRQDDANEKDVYFCIYLTKKNFNLAELSLKPFL